MQNYTCTDATADRLVLYRSKVKDSPSDNIQICRSRREYKFELFFSTGLAGSSRTFLALIKFPPLGIQRDFSDNLIGTRAGNAKKNYRCWPFFIAAAPPAYVRLQLKFFVQAPAPSSIMA